MNLPNKLFSTVSQQKILFFLAENVEAEFQEKEISARTGVRKSAVNLALRQLVEKKIIQKRKIGRSSLYVADVKNNIIREIKILQNIVTVEPLIGKLKEISQKIILFGSSSDGTNRKNSDIDLFILTNKFTEVLRIANNSSLAEKLQIIAKTPTEMLKINKKKPLLFQEIEKGRVLWEINENQGI